MFKLNQTREIHVSPILFLRDIQTDLRNDVSNSRVALLLKNLPISETLQISLFIWNLILVRLTSVKFEGCRF